MGIRGRLISLAAVLFLGAAILDPRLRPFLAGLVGSLALCAIIFAIARLPAARRLRTVAIGLACSVGFVCLFQNVLVHDALLYYGYLRSGVIDGDLDMYEEFVLRNPNAMYLPPPSTPVFHLGTPLTAVPALLAVLPLAAILDNHGVVPGGDGYGPLEVGAATLTSMMLAIGGIALTYRLARRFAGAPASALAAIVLTYASPLAFFAFIWPAYPHAVSVFLAACFLLVWLNGEGERSSWRFFLLGILAGALALVHPQDIVYLALPALDLAFDMRRSRWREALRPTVLMAAGAVAGFAPQIVAWTATSGRLLSHVYGEIGDPFRWSHPAFWDVLFSGYNGLFTWTPLCAAGVAGLFLLRREHPRLFRGAIALVGLQWWAIASYGYWWGGASFGARYFLSAWPVLCLGLAMILAAVARRCGSLAACLATAPFVYWNLLMMAQFRLEWIEHNRAPRFLEIMRRQLYDAPAALLDGLTGAHGWNQVLALELVRAAIASGSWVGILGSLAAIGAMSWLIVAWTRMLQRDVPVSPERGASAGQRMAVAAAACVALAAAAVAAVSGGHDGHRLVAVATDVPKTMSEAASVGLTLAAPLSGPTEAQPTAMRMEPVQRVEGERLTLDLISFLHHAESAEKGDVVGWVTPRGVRCDEITYPIRAGFETAATAPGRLESRPFMKHDLQDALVIHSWWQGDSSASHYWGHAYLARWELPEGCRPEQVVLRTEEGPALLEVREISLSASVPAS